MTLFWRSGRQRRRYPSFASGRDGLIPRPLSNYPSSRMLDPGHVDATLTSWLVRAGAHSQRLHDRLFVDLKLPYLQVDELHTPVAGNRRHSWLWVAIEPVSKIIPAIHLGTRKTEDAYRFIHDLSLRLAPGWIPAFTSDGLRAYFYALTAHFGAWLPGRGWRVSLDLMYGQLVKHRERRGQVNFATMRMILGKRWQLAQILLAQGLSSLIQTAFIERVNLTIRQGVARSVERPGRWPNPPNICCCTSSGGGPTIISSKRMSRCA